MFGFLQRQDQLKALHIVPFLYFKEKLTLDEVKQTLFEKLMPIARFRSKVEGVASGMISVQSAFVELDEAAAKASMDVLVMWLQGPEILANHWPISQSTFDRAGAEMI